MSTLYSKVKEYVRQESANGEWVKLDHRVIGSKWNVPSNTIRTILTLLSIDSEIMYRLIKTKSRFKPKEFKFCTPEEKAKFARSTQQLDIPYVEEMILKNKFSNYLDDLDLRAFYILMIFCEKLVQKGLRSEWCFLDVNEFCRLFSITPSDYQKIIEFLIEKNLLKSMINGAYKLTFSSEEIIEAEKHADSAILDNKIKLEGKIDPELMDENTNIFSELPELEDMKNNLNSIISIQADMNTKFMNQMKILDALKSRNDSIKYDRIAFSRLNEAYNTLNKNHDELKTEHDKIKKIKSAQDKFIKNYVVYIESELDSLTSEIVSLVKDYLELPAYKMNERGVRAKVENEILRSVMNHRQAIYNYKSDDHQ